VSKPYGSCSKFELGPMKASVGVSVAETVPAEC